MREQLLQEKLRTELNFLKSQINPHFLFNTLNNLYAIAERRENRELADGISELANLMRYMLYDCKAERVPLSKELTFLKSIIEIQRLRIAEEDEVVLAFDVEGNYNSKEIAPLILVPFVENAFKHGISPENQSFIKIALLVEENALSFEVRNSVFKDKKNELETHSGIGLENVKRRLELIYPEKYSLDILEENEVFKIKLKLELD